MSQEAGDQRFGFPSPAHYVEYSRHFLITVEEEGVRSPHNASYLRIEAIPNNRQDFSDEMLSLDRLVIRHREATFFWRVQGHHLQDTGVFDGDLVVVDRAILPHDGDLVVVSVAGVFLLRQYRVYDDQVLLEAEGETAFPLTQSEFWGTVTYSLHHPIRRPR
jgi:DNA polymerase V